MSLLMLKTRDLTWQDHTLNTEAMLAPARSVLLLNKHKTLGAKCSSDKQLYERQRAQCVKDFLSSRRIIDRQRQKLIQRQRELGTKEPRVRSAVGPRTTTTATTATATSSTSAKSPRDVSKESQGRSSSAPGGLNRSLVGLPTIYIDTGTTSPRNDDDVDSDSSSFFVTELSTPSPLPLLTRLSIIPAATPTSYRYHRSVAGRPQLSTSRSTPNASSMKAQHQTRPAPDPRDRATPTRSHASPALTQVEGRARESSRSQGHRHSVRFAEQHRDDNRDRHRHKDISTSNTTTASNHSNNNNVILGQREPMKDPALQAKVRVFIDDIHQFTVARRLGQTAKAKPELWPGVDKKEVQSPLVAKRYNSWHVDQAELLAVFDKFCKVQSPEELAKTKRLAAKLNANVKITRNQSIVPSVATFKSTRAFKSLLDRNNQ